MKMFIVRVELFFKSKTVTFRGPEMDSRWICLSPCTGQHDPAVMPVIIRSLAAADCILTINAEIEDKWFFVFQIEY